MGATEAHFGQSAGQAVVGVGNSKDLEALPRYYKKLVVSPKGDVERVDPAGHVGLGGHNVLYAVGHRGKDDGHAGENSRLECAYDGALHVAGDEVKVVDDERAASVQEGVLGNGVDRPSDAVRAGLGVGSGVIAPARQLGEPR